MTGPADGSAPATRDEIRRLTERVDVLEQVLENLNRMLLDGLKAYGERLRALEGAAAPGPPAKPLGAPKGAPRRPK